MGRAVEEVNMKSKQFFFVRTLEYLILGGLVVAFYAVLLTPQISYAAPICPNGITPVLYRGSYVCPRPQSPGTPQNLENSVRAPTTEGARCDAGKEPAAQWTGGTTMISVKCVAPGETPTTASPVAGTPETQKPVDCSSTSDYWFNLPICIVRASLAGIGSFFMWFGVKAVVLAGGLFELMLDYGIIKFGAMLKNIESGINDGWTALRDIANIIIIGLFVFIAVNIILGVKDFGDKKRVAHVLIVAVLINFSLLFTKVIIDASNFTAYQFYNSMAKKERVGGTTIESAPLPDATKQKDDSVNGIAGRFLGILGVDGISKSYDLIRKAQESQDSALIGFGYGLLMLILLLATAFVFLYGAFLIASRAILLIFLMLTSAVAFAAWLIPQQYVQGGFSKWWESLLKAAFFAPILMALLWITVIVSDTLVVASKAEGGYAANGSLGGLAGSAANSANLGQLFNFVIVLGLLFAAFATASAFSKTISGFRYAQAGVGGALVGASRIAGLAGRTLVGWPGSLGLAAARRYYHREVTDSEKEAGMRPGSFDYRRQGIRGLLGGGMLRGTDFLSRKTFDPLKQKLIGSAAETMGFPRGAIDATKDFGEGGIAGVLERKARRADELARRIGPTDAQKGQLAKQHEQQLAEQRALVSAIRNQEHPNVEKDVRGKQAGRTDAEEKVQLHQQDADSAASAYTSAENRQKSEMRLREEKIALAQNDARHQGATPEAIEALAAPLRALEQAHREELETIRERRSASEQELEAAQKVVRGLDEVARAETKQALDSHPRVVAAERNVERLGTAADKVSDREVSFRKKMLWDPRARPFVAGEMRNQQRRKDLKILAEESRKVDSGQAAPSPTPALTPTTSTDAPTAT